MNQSRLAIEMVFLLPMFLGCFGCSEDRQREASTAPPATAATVSLSLKDGWTLSSSWGKLVVTWKLEPVKLEGTEGRATALIVNKQYPPRLLAEKGGFRCYLDENSLPALRPGTWRISSDWGSNCDATLKPGENSIHFAYQVEGCVTGSGYPGE